MLSFCVVVVWCLLTAVTADYECLCSYHTELPVLIKPDVQAAAVGKLYEFDCRPTLPPIANQNYRAIAFERKMAFVQIDQGIQIKTCQGEPPSSDMIPSTAVPSSPSPAPGLQTTEPVSIKAATTPLTTPQAATTQSTSQLPTTQTTPQATTTQPTTQPPTTQTTPQATTTQSTTQPTTTQTTTPQPTTTQTTTQPTTRQFTTPPATPTSMSGNVQLCPKEMLDDASRSGTILAQYRQSCYELYPASQSWKHMETTCNLRGGHLLAINDVQEQMFIHQLLMQHQYIKAAWIGLNDIKHEEHFAWSSGELVTYTNWKPDRRSRYGHSTENCCLITATGQWDDVPCGLHFVVDFGETHAGICEISLSDHERPRIHFLDIIGR